MFDDADCTEEDPGGKGMTPYYSKDGIVLYCGVNREILTELGRFVLLLTDPPYGIDYEAGESSQAGIQKFERVHGDDVEFDPSPFHELSGRDLLWCKQLRARIAKGCRPILLLGQGLQQWDESADC